MSCAVSSGSVPALDLQATVRRPHARKGEKEDLGDRKGAPIRKLASALGVKLHVPLFAGIWHAGKVTGVRTLVKRPKKRKCNQAHDLRAPD